MDCRQRNVAADDKHGCESANRSGACSGEPEPMPTMPPLHGGHHVEGRLGVLDRRRNRLTQPLLNRVSHRVRP
jgi:hypothetical protein